MPGTISRAGRFLLLAVGAGILTSADHYFPRRIPAPDYLEAVTQIARQQSDDDSLAISSARSLFLTHGRRTAWAVVLLHGFGNSPQQFRGLTDSLYAHGFNVWVPRMPYHADRRGAWMLSRLTATDLRISAEAAADIGDGLGDSVAVLGFSMGGVAAAWIAQHRRDVRRVVIVSPALALARVPTSFRYRLATALLRLPNFTRGLMRDPIRSDRELGWSTHAIAQIFRLGFAVERSARSTPPAVSDIRMLLNAHDRTVNTAVAVALATRWIAAGAHVCMYLLPDTLHLPHDVIDETEPGGRPAFVHPILETLLDGSGNPF